MKDVILYADNRGATMVGYIVESFGGMGKQARSFNLAVATFAARTISVYTRDELLQSIFAAVSIEVQEGNRKVVETALQHATKLRRQPHPTEDIVVHARSLSMRPANFEEENFLFSKISSPQSTVHVPAKTTVQSKQVVKVLPAILSNPSSIV